MKIERIEPVHKIPKEFPPKIVEESVLKKIKKEPSVQDFDNADTVDISDEAREFLRNHKGL